jgi:diaminohydroxyphosphoribosylaminopyrimidine deaminase / 5-amino-6-(5-phosphoribosylamino)uracil reductase
MMPADPTSVSVVEQPAPGLAHVLAASRDQSFVVAQLGQSLDGRIATLSGESRWINKDAALDHVHRLRAAVDAVAVGIGTVIADDPFLNVRRVPGRNPARVVIDPKGRLPLNPRCFDPADGARCVVVRAAGCPTGHLREGVEVITLATPDGRLNPKAIVAALAHVGLPHLLIEGGAWTVSEFIDAQAVDRLHVLVAPVILGSGKPGLSLKPIERLSSALRPQAEIHVLADGDVLFDCKLR